MGTGKYLVVFTCILLLGIIIGYTYCFNIVESINNIPVPNNIGAFNVDDLRFEFYNDSTEQYEKYNRQYDIIPITSGHSMHPILTMDSKIICLMDFTKKELQIGNIVLYDINNSWYEDNGFFVDASYGIHRIIKKQEINNTKYYTTKGDNNKEQDPLNITQENIICVVSGVLY